MSNEDDYDFIKISLKKDVANQIKIICDDAKSYGIFIDKSSLLRVMLFNRTIIEYAIKKCINEKHDVNDSASGDSPHSASSVSSS